MQITIVYINIFIIVHSCIYVFIKCYISFIRFHLRLLLIYNQ